MNFVDKTLVRLATRDTVFEGLVIDATDNVRTGGVYVVTQSVILAAERILGPRMTSREGAVE
jgi:hypothetical protein